MAVNNLVNVCTDSTGVIEHKCNDGSSSLVQISAFSGGNKNKIEAEQEGFECSSVDADVSEQRDDEFYGSIRLEDDCLERASEPIKLPLRLDNNNSILQRPISFNKSRSLPKYDRAGVGSSKSRRKRLGLFRTSRNDKDFQNSDFPNLYSSRSLPFHLGSDDASESDSLNENNDNNNNNIRHRRYSSRPLSLKNNLMDDDEKKEKSERRNISSFRSEKKPDSSKSRRNHHRRNKHDKTNCNRNADVQQPNKVLSQIDKQNLTEQQQQQQPCKSRSSSFGEEVMKSISFSSLQTSSSILSSIVRLYDYDASGEGEDSSLSVSKRGLLSADGVECVLPSLSHVSQLFSSPSSGAFKENKKDNVENISISVASSKSAGGSSGYYGSCEFDGNNNDEEDDISFIVSRFYPTVVSKEEEIKDGGNELPSEIMIGKDHQDVVPLEEEEKQERKQMKEIQQNQEVKGEADNINNEPSAAAKRGDGEKGLFTLIDFLH